MILYHSNCFDGWCAAYFFAFSFTGRAPFIAVNHGEAPPDVTEQDVYLLDFCYPRDVLQQMADAAKSITILDHHKTALEALTGWTHPKVSVTFDLNKSGGRLAWEYLYQRKLLAPPLQETYTLEQAHWLVEYTEDRDLWRWQLPSSKEINAALRSYLMGFSSWDKLSEMSPQDLVIEGNAILRSDQRLVEAHLPFARPITLAGHAGFAVNATCLQSEIAHELAIKAEFGACYVVRQDGSWVWSLRSRQDTGIDVSKIAVSFGGGGHKHAAGCLIAANKIGELLGW
jgi:oligoribonuclease NrnB/cAMP/cGMP phosphodiesterase (DHH superfamily)